MIKRTLASGDDNRISRMMSQLDQLLDKYDPEPTVSKALSSVGLTAKQVRALLPSEPIIQPDMDKVNAGLAERLPPKGIGKQKAQLITLQAEEFLKANKGHAFLAKEIADAIDASCHGVGISLHKAVRAGLAFRIDSIKDEKYYSWTGK